MWGLKKYFTGWLAKLLNVKNEVTLYQNGSKRFDISQKPPVSLTCWRKGHSGHCTEMSILGVCLLQQAEKILLPLCSPVVAFGKKSHGCAVPWLTCASHSYSRCLRTTSPSSLVVVALLAQFNRLPQHVEKNARLLWMRKFSDAVQGTVLEPSSVAGSKLKLPRRIWELCWHWRQMHKRVQRPNVVAGSCGLLPAAEHKTLWKSCVDS